MTSATGGERRLCAKGKFVFRGDTKLYLRGVTYGTFRPGPDGEPFPEPREVERDFARMTASGVNAIRVYTVPPRWLLDLALAQNLAVMVGLPWEDHVAFLDDRELEQSIEERVRQGVRACAGHPAVLCYAVGNEIPASIVRWHGRRRVERFLARLCRIAKAEDPGALVTYVNYPSTEYLDLSFCDLVCFNVYLESAERFTEYVARLQSLAGDRPLVVAELGLDSRRHGENEQARTLEAEIRAAFASGCSGTFVFAWTDEWHRGGFDVEDWGFGVTDRERRPKPALAALSAAFVDVPFPMQHRRPRVSVIVCTHNGARTLRESCEGVRMLAYPDIEPILVDDGSTDESAAIAAELGFRVIRTPNRGLAAARNAGLEAAAGEIVAYLDDDAYPDPHWLCYLVETIEAGPCAGAGGPNLQPQGDGAIAECVANAPGGPAHVLLSDRIAEHIPGCNMAFRRDALVGVGGFDPQFRVAGDDVDICWQLERDGSVIGFSPAAVVWHHRRSSVRAFWRQQRGYGRAEALLERKWPAKYNTLGHVSWSGRLYGRGASNALGVRRHRIRYGLWGTADFQTADEPGQSTLAVLLGVPEWYLVIAALGSFSAVGVLWRPLLYGLPLLALAVLLSLVHAVAGAQAGASRFRDRSAPVRAGLRLMTIWLHLLQPVARLAGRLGHGLTPWRRRGPRRPAFPRPRTLLVWSEHWLSPTSRLQAVGRALLDTGAVVLRGGAHDRWELEVRGGIFGSARLRMGLEEHGAGRQLARFHVWPRCALSAATLAIVFLTLSLGAALDGAAAATLVLGAIGLAVVLMALKDCASAMASALRAVARLERVEPNAVMEAAHLDERVRLHAAAPAVGLGGDGP